MAGTDIGVLGHLLNEVFKSNEGLKPLLRGLIQQVMEVEAGAHVNAAQAQECATVGATRDCPVRVSVSNSLPDGIVTLPG